MAPTPETSIWLALEALVDSLSLTPSLPVAMPNEDFTPPQDNGPPVQPLNYLSVRHLPNTTDSATLSATGKNRHRGILQITLHARKNQHITVSKEIVGTIVDHFKLGTTSTYNSIPVRVEFPPSVAADIAPSSDALMMIPISVRYFADVSRS